MFIFATLSATTGMAATHDVLVTDAAFDPAVIEVTAGDTVRWIFLGTVDQSSTSVAGQAEVWDSGLLPPNVFFEVVLTMPGNYAYYDQTFGGDDAMGGAFGVSGRIAVLPDDDGDGLSNQREGDLGTDPNDPDTDADGLDDLEEVDVRFSNPLNPDTDGDGLTDLEDVVAGASPLLVDTDGDGLTDPDEVLVHGTSPSLADTDLGGVEDGLEVAVGTDPFDPTDDIRPPVMLSFVVGPTAGAVNVFAAGPYPPNANVRLMRSLVQGNALSGAHCAVVTGLGTNPRALAVDQADANGRVEFSQFIPANTMNTVFLQTLDEDTCTLSNVLTVTVP